MISTHVTTTGAAGTAPIPAAVVRASSRGGAVQLAPTAAPQHGTGLLSAVRPWAPDLTGTSAPCTAGHAERTTSSTPGAQPPRDPLS